jgi:ribosome-binding factor A
MQRLNAQFREELSELILHHLRDPRLHGMVSITRVDVAPTWRMLTYIERAG